MECVTGMIVKSISGHDSGTWYAVVRCENSFVYIADGKLRKVEKPKKKNIRHIQKSKHFINLGDGLTNKKLKHILHEYNYSECKNAENTAEKE